mmetsp:Transcript_2373/g.8449  ORF Transcript_2373/g.8449 Transcript_2373/m.8449 type:complete len:229 (-) Transcript_2373:82-768(-)
MAEADGWAVVLVLCGSFSPVHKAHLGAFREARKHLEQHTDHVFLEGLLSPVSDAYKKKDLAPAADRIAMLQLAIEEHGDSRLRVDAWEAEQDHYTPTLAVLRHIAKRYTEPVCGRPVHVMLLCGADLLASFLIPGVWSEEDMSALANEFGFVVLTRDSGISIEDTVEQCPPLACNKDNIIICQTDALKGVSSTSIRAKARQQADVDDMTFSSVAKYLTEKKLWVESSP